MRIMQCQNHEDVSLAPGGREQVVRLQCPLEGAVSQVR